VTTTQRIAVSIGAAVVAVMAAFPPFQKDGGFVGFRWVTSRNLGHYDGQLIDATRLGLQLLVVLLVTVVLVVVLRKPAWLLESQLVVLAIGSALAVCVAVWPPWGFGFLWGGDFAGYHFVFAGQAPVRPTGYYATIDPLRTALHVVILGSACSALTVWCGWRARR